jgi:hypothetical protein
MQLRSEERTDAAIPAYWTAAQSAAQGRSGFLERIDVKAQIDAERMPGTMETPRRRWDQPAAPMDIPDVRDPRMSLDKKSEFRCALPACLHFALADFHEKVPDFGCHSTMMPAAKKLQAPALKDGNEKGLQLLDSLRGSNLYTNSHGHCGNPRSGYRDSENSASSHAR